MLPEKAIAIVDDEVRAFIKTNFVFNIERVVSPMVFIRKHRNWLTNSNFYIRGLDRFEHAYITNGCTDAFNDFYNNNVYVLEGEYTYHRDANKATVTQIDSIPPDSRLIISYPFAATGNTHKEWDYILNYCSNNNILIFVDACLSGVSLGNLDLMHPSITHIAFSFSKAFGTGHVRTGVLYTKSSVASPALVTNKHLYINHNNTYLHQQLMENFSSDFIFCKYRFKQINICKEHNLVQSDCVLYGLENDSRKCITRLLCNY